jgi:ribonuclease P protein component
MYSKARSAACPMFVLYARRTGRERSRLGMSASAKLGNAVYRNRVRRRIRAVFEETRAAFGGSFDVVCVVRSAAYDADYSAMCAEFRRLVRKIDAAQKAAPPQYAKPQTGKPQESRPKRGAGSERS